MSNIAISVENLGKRYRIGKAQQRHDTLRDALVDGLRGPMRHLRTEKADDEHIWALKDVSFEVKHGDVVGIIGRNGAGKSTLLKILSRITEPTTGRAVVHGRVGSLLEVGTGFHPELTGRENIYLNGAILGMRRTEIDRKFDEIVAFAEIEKFLDTPVKRYSSGMYVRLAFAVAAHLEPEVLVVDEVLAVGDVNFRKKCLGKMRDISDEGRTVLFVSHDLTSISMLCGSAFLLHTGSLRQVGPARIVIDTYVRNSRNSGSYARWEWSEAPGDGDAKIIGVGAVSSTGHPTNVFDISDPIALALDFTVLRGGIRLNPVFSVSNSLGAVVFSTSNYDDREWGNKQYTTGSFRATCVVPSHLFNTDSYVVTAFLIQDASHVKVSAEKAIQFFIDDDGSTRGDYVSEWRGIVRPRCAWSITENWHPMYDKEHKNVP